MAFLRRPFSIHGASRRRIDVLYKVIGKGTSVLSEKKRGEFLDMLGPLGNGFKISDDLKCAILVCGGMGVAPMLMLARELKTRRKAETVVLVGAGTKRGLHCVKEFRNLGCEVKVSTEDGSSGFKGMVTELLDLHLSSKIPKPLTAVFACGPRQMLEKVAEISQKHGVEAQVSLEEEMACGVGACYGCPVRTVRGYEMVCRDGPVFRAEDIVWKQG